MAYNSKITMDLAMYRLGKSIPKRAFNETCPGCESDRPRNLLLHVDMDKSVFRCPKCNMSGGAMHYYGFIKYGYSRIYMDSNKDIQAKLLSELEGNETDLLAVERAKPVETARKDVPNASKEERDKTYSQLLNMLDISDAHYNNLISRGLREQDIIENGYKTVPKMGLNKLPQELRKIACDLLGVPGFFKKGESWTMQKNNPGFFIPARDVCQNGMSRLGLIQGMQIRYDTVSKDDTRYKWFSTKDMPSGSPAETYAHFVGFPEKTILLTEGPLKGDIIYRFLNIPVVAIPGVSAINHLILMLPILWQLGVRHIKLAFDMDYKENINVSSAYVKLIIVLEEFGFYVERFLWNENYKGLDDYLLFEYLSRGGKLGIKK